MINLRKFVRAQKSGRPAEVNRLLFKWLSDDDDRAALYRCLLKKKRVLKFQSGADTKLRLTDNADSVFHQDVYLLTARSDVERALTDTDCFSNSPYQALGSGTFMLGLDAVDADHDRQREFASACLRHVDAPSIAALAAIAFKAGAVLPLKQRQFDLVDLAEQVSLRFAAFLFGFAQADHPLLEATMRKAYLGLNYQILGRHFVSEPALIQEAAINMGALLRQVSHLIGLYRERVGRDEEDEFDRIGLELEDLRSYRDRNKQQPLARFEPVLKRIARYAGAKPAARYSATEQAVIVVGLIAGTIGNVQASVAIAINEFFRDSGVFERARDAARKCWLGEAAADTALQGLIREALRLNPPVAFLPRKTAKTVLLGTTSIAPDSVVVLAMGGATRDWLDDPDQFKETRNNILDPLIFGGAPGRGGFVHQCIGQHLALPLIAHIVRQILLLPGLTQRYDPRTGKPLRLQKLWGFNCQKYPLEYNRFGILKQSPLNVIMKVKAPVCVHAEDLKKIIQYGAPRIEKKLRDAGHVHFAQFMFLDNDTKLALFTLYDRDFDAYIEHFALQIGSLFDKLFEHIEDAPPLPVSEFPKEFVDTIRRYDAPPAGNYFFSAYPGADVSMITHHYPPEDA